MNLLGGSTARPLLIGVAALGSPPPDAPRTLRAIPTAHGPITGTRSTTARSALSRRRVTTGSDTGAGGRDRGEPLGVALRQELLLGDPVAVQLDDLLGLALAR